MNGVVRTKAWIEKELFRRTSHDVSLVMELSSVFNITRSLTNFFILSIKYPFQGTLLHA